MTASHVILANSGGLGKREVLDKIINSKVLLTLKVGESGVLTCLICGLDKILKEDQRVIFLLNSIKPVNC